MPVWSLLVGYSDSNFDSARSLISVCVFSYWVYCKWSIRAQSEINLLYSPFLQNSWSSPNEFKRLHTLSAIFTRLLKVVSFSFKRWTSYDIFFEPAFNWPNNLLREDSYSNTFDSSCLSYFCCASTFISFSRFKICTLWFWSSSFSIWFSLARSSCLLTLLFRLFISLS